MKKQTLCETLTAILRVTNLKLEDLTNGTTNIEDCYQKAITVFAKDILDSTVAESGKKKDVFKEISNINEEITYKSFMYKMNMFNLNDMEVLSNDEVMNMKLNLENAINLFAQLYSLRSGYARNKQVLDSYRYLKNKVRFQIDYELMDRGIIEDTRFKFEC